jgi:hypothetical protein
MIPVELFHELGVQEDKGSCGRGNSSMMKLIRFKNLCECLNVPPLNPTIKEK